MVRQVGIEDELLLVDDCGRPVPAADVVVARLGAYVGTTAVVREFFQAQVELVTAPARRLDALGFRLTEARQAVAGVMSAQGGACVGVGLPVLGTGGGPVTAGDRFEQIRQTYAKVATDSLMCALQIHVEIESREEGVAVIDRARPWIPVLLALSANSPFWDGRDTGFASWRSQVWKLWPSTGPTELFGGVEAYDAYADRMLASGATLDRGLLNMDLRLSARHPTVELRVADSSTDTGVSLLIAGLTRALVSTVAREWRDGLEPAAWRVDELRAAAWRAARFGLEGDLVDPVTRELTTARQALGALATFVGEELEAAGDGPLVGRLLGDVLSTGSGAERQRRSLEVDGDLERVVRDLAQRTVRPCPPLDADVDLDVGVLTRSAPQAEGGRRA